MEWCSTLLHSKKVTQSLTSRSTLSLLLQGVICSGGGGGGSYGISSFLDFHSCRVSGCAACLVCAPVCSQNNTLEMLSKPVGSLVCRVSTIASIFTLFLLYFHLISAFQSCVPHVVLFYRRKSRLRGGEGGAKETKPLPLCRFSQAAVVSL